MPKKKYGLSDSTNVSNNTSSTHKLTARQRKKYKAIEEYQTQNGLPVDMYKDQKQETTPKNIHRRHESQENELEQPTKKNRRKESKTEITDDIEEKSIAKYFDKKRNAKIFVMIPIIPEKASKHYGAEGDDDLGYYNPEHAELLKLGRQTIRVQQYLYNEKQEKRITYPAVIFLGSTDKSRRLSGASIDFSDEDSLIIICAHGSKEAIGSSQTALAFTPKEFAEAFHTAMEQELEVINRNPDDVRSTIDIRACNSGSINNTPFEQENSNETDEYQAQFLKESFIGKFYTILTNLGYRQIKIVGYRGYICDTHNQAIVSPYVERVRKMSIRSSFPAEEAAFTILTDEEGKIRVKTPMKWNTNITAVDKEGDQEQETSSDVFEVITQDLLDRNSVNTGEDVFNSAEPQISSTTTSIEQEATANNFEIITEQLLKSHSVEIANTKLKYIRLYNSYFTHKTISEDTQSVYEKKYSKRSQCLRRLASSCLRCVSKCVSSAAFQRKLQLFVLLVLLHTKTCYT
jgi:hypothetical protein